MNELLQHHIFDIITHHSVEGVWVCDERECTAFVNKRMCEMLGYDEQEMLQVPVYAFMNEAGIESSKKHLERRKTGQSGIYEFCFLKKTGAEVWVLMNVTPIIMEGNYRGSIAMISDITKRKQLEREKELSMIHYQSLFDNSPIPIWDEDFSLVKQRIDELKRNGIKNIKRYLLLNQDEVIYLASLLKVNAINQAVVELNEAVNKEQVLTQYGELTTSKSLFYIILQAGAIANNETHCEFDAELKTFKGNLRFVHFKWSVVKGYEGSYARVHLTTTDVTERIKEENLRLQHSNREKEMLLKEIHHRVKNNLQIISSLLRLQARSIDDEKTKELLEISLGRIHSMATVHELLYRSSEYSQINFKEYLDALIHSMIGTLVAESQQIKVQLDIIELITAIDTAIPLGLLINEILTNSFKHAFQGKQQGQVYVRIRPLTTEKLEISVGDDGIGMPESLASSTPESLGFSLIQSLTEQLDGNITFQTGSNGTHYTLIIPLYN
ncbi:MAG: PAS domain-containing sensor histidine kinase [Fluviicola sp.]